MRGIKLEKSHIYILETETLSRRFSVPDSSQEIVCSIPCIITHIRTNILFVNTFLFSGKIYKNVGILLGGVSDCEELVGVTHRR